MERVWVPVLAFAAAVLSECGTSAIEPMMNDGPDASTLRRSETELLIPKIIADDLHRRASDFVTRVFPDIDREWLQAELDKALVPERQIDVRAAARRLPRILIGEQPLLEMSLPSANHMVLFPRGDFSSARYYGPLPGVAVDEESEGPLTFQETEARAREVLMRLVGSLEESRRFRIQRPGEAQAGYNYFHFYERRADGQSRRGLSISIYICRANGAIRKVSLLERLPPPIISHARALAMGEAIAKVSDHGRGRASLTTFPEAGSHRLVWQYLVPPEPMGGPEDTTYWDANTGELLYSEVLQGGTSQKPYKNPTFFVEATEKWLCATSRPCFSTVLPN